jgi:hypothetical protein
MAYAPRLNPGSSEALEPLNLFASDSTEWPRLAASLAKSANLTSLISAS